VAASVLVAVIAVLAFGAGRLSASTTSDSSRAAPSARTPDAVSPHATRAAITANAAMPTARHRTIGTGFVPGDAGVIGEGAGSASGVPPGVAADVVLTLLHHLDDELAAHQHTPGAGPPERFLNSQSQYLDGYVAASLTLGVADESTARAVQEQIDGVLCSGASAEQTIVLLRLMTRIPDLATPGGIDCVLSSESTESPVLWEAIDAWRKAELPESPEVARWRSRASDRRTLRRLEPDNQERR